MQADLRRNKCRLCGPKNGRAGGQLSPGRHAAAGIECNDLARPAGQPAATETEAREGIWSLGRHQQQTNERTDERTNQRRRQHHYVHSGRRRPDIGRDCRPDAWRCVARRRTRTNLRLERRRWNSCRGPHLLCRRASMLLVEARRSAELGANLQLPSGGARRFWTEAQRLAGAEVASSVR